MMMMKMMIRMFNSSSSSMYGNCYTFNSLKQTKRQKGRTSLLAGQKQGLSLILDIGQPFYMKNGLTTSAGVRVTIHDPSVR